MPKYCVVVWCKTRKPS